ncbi:MAG TPA: hypothetical protein VEO02_07370 [Thermoanaerobaculia bacterium]|nr:hypothetical protein [Thermoanaerobaculia bacterium]
MSRGMRPRYAWAGPLFNWPGSCVRSQFKIARETPRVLQVAVIREGSPAGVQRAPSGEAD